MQPSQEAGRWKAAALTKVAWWRAPKLGKLRQHPPEPLRVPRRYVRLSPPSPAPSLTLVTPSFQQGRFLARAIRSVLDQRYPTLEYVVQDGGSDDGSVEVLQAFGGGLTRWESAPDDGQANAINRGFAGTSGELMAFLNSDDLLLPGSLAYVGRYFAAHPEVDAIYGHRLLVDERGRKLGSWILPPHDDETLRLIDFVPQESLFWRRSLWERCGGYIDEEFEFAVDWELLLRFAEAGARMVRVPRFLAAFRVHEGQKTHAYEELGSGEVARLRERSQGRPIEQLDADRMVEPYLRRHRRRHLLHRVWERLPLPRVEVDAGPVAL